MAEREGSGFDPEYYFKHREKGTIYVEEEEPIGLPLPDGGEIISLDKGSSPFGPPPGSQEVLDEITRNGKLLDAISTYDIKTLKAQQNIRNRFGLPNDQKIFLSSGGSDEMIERLTYALDIRLRRRVWGITPHFPDLNNYVDRLQPERSGLEEKDFVGLKYGSIHVPIDSPPNLALDIAEKSLSGAKAKNIKPSVYLCRPGTPRGDVTDKERAEEFIKFAERNGNLVILDEAFLATDSDSLMSMTNDVDNLIVMGSLSKVISLPGIPVGFMATSKGIEPYIEEFERPYHVRGASALLANEFTDPKMIHDHQADVLRRNRRNKGLLSRGLEAEGIHVLGWTSMDTLIMAVQGNEGLYDNLKYQGIKTSKGSGFFSASVESGAKYGYGKITNSVARVTTPSDEKDIPTIIERFKKANAA